MICHSKEVLIFYKDLWIELYAVSLYRVNQELNTLATGMYYVLLDLKFLSFQTVAS